MRERLATPNASFPRSATTLTGDRVLRSSVTPWQSDRSVLASVADELRPEVEIMLKAYRDIEIPVTQLDRALAEHSRLRSMRL